jgi:uncharacterized repeat protein (TIGR02543 family)
MPSYDVIVYANWIINSYTISFETNGGNTIEPIIQEYNSVLTLPNTPIKEGFVFEGWYQDQEFLIPVDTYQIPAINSTLYAKWLVENKSIKIGGMNDENINHVITDSNNNIIVVGSTNSSELFTDFDNEYDGIIAKFDQNYNLIWIENFNVGLDTNENIYRIIENQIGNYIIVGGTGSNQGFIAEINTSGQTLWFNNFELFEFRDILAIENGGFMLSGVKFNAEGTFGAILTLNSQGEIIDQIIDDQLGFYNNMILLNDGSILVVGGEQSDVPTKIDGIVKKYNADGILLWQYKTNNTEKTRYFHDIVLVEDEYYIVGKANNHSMIVQLDSFGKLIEMSIFSSSIEIYLNSIHYENHHIYVSGGFFGENNLINKSTSEYVGLIYKLNKSLELIEFKIFGSELDVLTRYSIIQNDLIYVVGSDGYLFITALF